MIQQTIDLLGKHCKDRVSGFVGVISTVSFDLYGCVQAIVTPSVDGDGKRRESEWFDIKRLEVSGERAMPAPNFEGTKFGSENGPGDRPRSTPY